jgi:serine/threonine protein kinase
VVGTRAGRYTLLDHFASGGTADLWVALRAGAREVCLLKQLAPELLHDPRAVRRLQREASIAFRLNHPSFSRMISAGDEGGRFCIATELVAGQNVAVVLRAAAEQRRAVPPEIALAIVTVVLDGLAHLHTLRDEEGRPLELVHRDLTTGNVVVGFQGDVKIIDFGTMHGRLDDFHTAPGVILGTPEAMSPEQAGGEPIDARTDLYAAGLLYYQLLTGRNPFAGASMLDTLERVRTITPRSVAELRPDVPPALAAVIDRALSKAREDRPADALELQHELLEAAGVRPASKEAISRFIVALLPQELERLRALMSRGSQVAEALQDFVTEESIQQGAFTRTGIPMPGSAASQVRTSVVRVRGDELAPVIPLPLRSTSMPRVVPAALTPSVMEMPGTAVVKVSGTQLVRDTRALRTEVERWRSRFIAAIAAGVAGMLVVGVLVALWVSRDAAPSEEVVAVAPEAVGVAAVPSAGVPVIEAEEPTISAAPAPPAAGAVVAPSPRSVAPPRPTPAPARATSATSVAGASSAAPPAAAPPSPAGASATSVAGGAAAPSAASPVASTRSAAPGSLRSNLEAEIVRLRTQAKAVQEEPKGSKAFDALVTDVGRVARMLPEAEQRKVLADVSAAERSLELDPLLSAINKLTRAARELP